MQKLDGLREKISGFSARAGGTIEMGAGAWIGGLMDGKLQWPVSMGLVFGFTLTALDYLNMSAEGHRFYGNHYGNLGNGFLASYLARAGQRFGTRMLERSSTKIAERRAQGGP